MLRKKPTRRLRRWQKILLGISVLLMAVCCGGLALVTFWPDVAAQNIDKLRDVIGDEAVAQLETVVLSVQDRVQQVEYQLGIEKPAAPWAASGAVPATEPALPTDAGTTATRVALNSSPTVTDQAVSIASPTPGTTGKPPTTASTYVASTPTPYPTASPAAAITAIASTSGLAAWRPAPVNPLGKLAGEGQWSPYVQTADGQTVAYRTFLQPDAWRPYAIPAIISFDLQATRLHFVLGSVEPLSTLPRPPGTGTIPAADRQPGVLLATFNGGFKARHGDFGAMANGFTALPPVDGLATVAMYTDGRVKIGQWGKDIKNSPDLAGWRQNGQMLVHQGQINPETSVTTVAANWGATIKGGTITWRSAIGLSADGQTFYYAAGLQLDAATLAKVMAQVGAAEAFQLDVNQYWVHFAAIRSNGTTLVAEPLFDAMKKEADRYLKGFSRDFFYVTMDTKH